MRLWVQIVGLLLIPVIYSLLAPLARPRAHAGVRLDRELGAVPKQNLSENILGEPAAAE